jgi:hypothetical protein
MVVVLQKVKYLKLSYLQGIMQYRCSSTIIMILNKDCNYLICTEIKIVKSDETNNKTSFMIDL